MSQYKDYKEVFCFQIIKKQIELNKRTEIRTILLVILLPLCKQYVGTLLQVVIVQVIVT